MLTCHNRHCTDRVTLALQSKNTAKTPTTHSERGFWMTPWEGCNQSIDGTDQIDCVFSVVFCCVWFWLLLIAFSLLLISFLKVPLFGYSCDCQQKLKLNLA